MTICPMALSQVIKSNPPMNHTTRLVPPTNGHRNLSSFPFAISLIRLCSSIRLSFPRAILPLTHSPISVFTTLSALSAASGVQYLANSSYKTQFWCHRVLLRSSKKLVVAVVPKSLPGLPQSQRTRVIVIALTQPKCEVTSTITSLLNLAT
jgi:hypothetical protein